MVGVSEWSRTRDMTRVRCATCDRPVRGSGVALQVRLSEAVSHKHRVSETYQFCAP